MTINVTSNNIISVHGSRLYMCMSFSIVQLDVVAYFLLEELEELLFRPC